MKTLTYERDKIVRAVWLLDQIAFFDSKTEGFSGIEKSRMVAELANILDSGKPGELIEKDEEVKDDGDSDMGQQTV